VGLTGSHVCLYDGRIENKGGYFMLRRTRWFALISMFAIGSATAAEPEPQPMDLIYTYSEKSDLEDTLDSDLGIHEVGVDYLVPAREEADFTLWSGLRFKWTHFEIEDASNVDVYSFRIPLDLDYFAYEPWGFVGDFTPALNTDFSGTDTDDIRWLGSGMVKYQVNEDVSVLGGARYGTEFGEEESYPIGGVHWAFMPNFNVELTYPSPSLTFSPSDFWSFYIAGSADGDEWSIREAGEDIDLSLETYRWGIGITRVMDDDSKVDVSFGQETQRSIEAVEGPVSLVDSDVDDGYYGRITLTFREE